MPSASLHSLTHPWLSPLDERNQNHWNMCVCVCQTEGVCWRDRHLWIYLLIRRASVGLPHAKVVPHLSRRAHMVWRPDLKPWKTWVTRWHLWKYRIANFQKSIQQKLEQDWRSILEVLLSRSKSHQVVWQCALLVRLLDVGASHLGWSQQRNHPVGRW